MDLMFSIIVPVYNRETNISNVIRSVLEQDYENWELIIINDGSNDGTENICKKYSEIDSRIHYFYKENGGVSSARNAGLELAKGEYIIFVDSDNSLKQNALYILSLNINAYQSADIICFGFSSSDLDEWIPDVDGQNYVVTAKMIRDMYLPTHINILPQDKYFLKNFVWNKCYKREFIISQNIKFDENRRTWEDGIFVVKCLNKANRLLLIPKALYNAYCEIDVTHLSSMMFEGLISQYVADETVFKKSFERQYNFANEHYCKSNFNVLTMLFQRAVITYGEKAKYMINDVIKEPIVLFWCDHIVYKTPDENKIIKYIKAGNVEKIYNCYSTSVWKRAVQKVKHVFK